MKKNIYLIFVLSLVLVLTFSISLAFGQQHPPEIVGKAAILIDKDTGEILYQKNSHNRMHPASITKIMTAIIALEKGELSDEITAGPDVLSSRGSKVYIDNNETLTLEELLYALMVSSANDASIVIANHIGGSIEGFAEMMNIKAREIGARNTNFVNPHGLTDENHLTTAYDMSLIAAYAMELPFFSELVSTRNHTIPWAARNEDRTLINRNRILRNYDGGNGIKTGFTHSAGQTLVASATRNNMTLISVVLNSTNNGIWTDTENILDYGFENFKKVPLISSDNPVKELFIRHGNEALLAYPSSNLEITVPNSFDIETDILFDIDISDNLKAPIFPGQILGQLTLFYDDNIIGAVNLVSNQDLSRPFYTYWWFWLISLFIPFRVFVAYRRYKRKKSETRNSIRTISLEGRWRRL